MWQRRRHVRPNETVLMRGFTLIELMIVLVILAVVLVVAVPSYDALALRTKLRTYTNEIVSSAYLARSEAIKRNALMRMCISTDGETCAESGDWDQGWVVMDPNDAVVRYRQGVDDMGMVDNDSVHTVVFRPSGAVTPPGAEIGICNPPQKKKLTEWRLVRILTSGRPVVEPLQPDDCP